ncbi:TPA: hypothetical protein SMP59_000166 [Proteus mirabilis]|nr:hypothetical protein [Proteus mirabilis]HEK0726916.1 hypothetical protein [Proteus mirabilis]HEK2070590.1 hypothetical protein [Proteus mirabilis]
MAVVSLSRVSTLNMLYRGASKIMPRKIPFHYDVDVQVNIRNLSKERCLWALKHKAHQPEF